LNMNSPLLPAALIADLKIWRYAIWCT
jgi:hypothetical protein